MEPTDSKPNQEALVAALHNPARYPHPVDTVECLETHISYVLLAGDYAYKIKKAVDLGFLDFRTLAARKFYCEEELRLNRRLAPALYLDVVPIAGAPASPVLGGDGAAIEYAVKMRRFPQDRLLNRLLLAGALNAAHIDALADQVADFHARASVAGEGDAFGTPEAIVTPALENFTQIRAAGEAPEPEALDRLEHWTRAEIDRLHDTFRARKGQGRVRECHGDLHLGNAALVDGAVTIFDCLEFSATLRWIDVMNEVAFTVMDLHDRDRPDFARRFLNRYLEHTGDYEGLSVLRFYVVYRALVRAKVHWLRALQPGVDRTTRERLLAQYGDYLKLALRQIASAPPALVITHGLSGSGKTTHTQSLLESMDAVRLRSDIERKRLQGFAALARTGSAIAEGAYTPDATARTYARLLELARATLAAGYTAIVDATFLQRAPREQFRRLAQERAVPFAIVDFVLDEASLRERLRERTRRGGDASEADVRVLDYQLTQQEPLAPNERTDAISFDARLTPGDAARAAWAPLLARLARAPA